METLKKPGKKRTPSRPKPDGVPVRKDKTPWPTLENEVMEKWARNIKKKRNEPGSIPYPFDRE